MEKFILWRLIVQNKLTEKGCNGAPEKEIVTVYSFKKETMEQYSFGNSVPVEIYDGFSIKI